jgi:hypothetical protein
MLISRKDLLLRRKRASMMVETLTFCACLLWLWLLQVQAFTVNLKGEACSSWLSRLLQVPHSRI